MTPSWGQFFNEARRRNISRESNPGGGIDVSLRGGFFDDLPFVLVRLFRDQVSIVTQIFTSGTAPASCFFSQLS